MILREYINKSLEENKDLSKNNLFKIIIFLSKTINDNESLYLNMNNEIDFNLNKSNEIINKFIYKNIPLEYLIKNFYFYNIRYHIEKGVFIPRNETENITIKIIEKYKNDHNLKFLDLCSGSGCIANTIQYYLKDSIVYGIEKKIKPWLISNKNKNEYNLKTKFILLDIRKWIKNNNILFDVVICNPPYIDINFDVQENVKKEPSIALYAKDNGLYYYEFIIKNINKILNKNGELIFEIGFDQKEAIEKILNKFNLYNYEFKKDQYGIYRNLYIRNNENENIKK